MQLKNQENISKLSTRTTDENGVFIRQQSAFQHWITADGSAGPTGTGGFEAAKGRYHLIIALNCPWAHRTLLMYTLKKLENIVSLSIVHPQRTEQGWAFNAFEGSTKDPVYDAKLVRDFYHKAQNDYSGRYTVPLLWDKQRETIVSNESADIIRMFNCAFNNITNASEDYYPQILRPEIDAMNEFVYEKINNGVYRAGFAKSQNAYETAYNDIFLALDHLDKHLDKKSYLIGEQLTEADLRLFPTLIRFEHVYYSLFKCNKRHLQDYPALWRYTRKIYQLPSIADTVNFNHIRHGYWRTSERNPTGIIPLGPEIDLRLPEHDIGKN